MPLEGLLRQRHRWVGLNGRCLDHRLACQSLVTVTLVGVGTLAERSLD